MTSGLAVVARRLFEGGCRGVDDDVGQLRAFHGLHHSIGGVPNAVAGCARSLL